MSFSIYQTGLDKPAPEGLARAFRSLRELVDIDAHTLSNDGYGVLTSGLSREHATALHLALEHEGICTEIVAEDQIVSLPSARHTKRLDCQSDTLLIYDTLGRPQDVSWDHVVMVAAGFVTLPEFERKEKTRVVMRGGGANLPSYPIVLTDVTVRERRHARLVLNLILDVAPGRLELLGHEGQYNYLGPRRSLRYMANFAMLVQDLCAYAKQAVFNKGAESLIDDDTVTFHYPTRHAFEEEITWLLWHKLGARKR